MPKWKGKQVSKKRYYDLAMHKEFREFVKAKRTVYLPRESVSVYVNDKHLANVTDVQIERPWHPLQLDSGAKQVVTKSRAIGISELTEEGK